MTREKIKEELRKIGDELIEAIKEEVFACVVLCNSGRLTRLTEAVHNHMDAELVRTIRKHRMHNGAKLLEELCNKIGVQKSIMRKKGEK